MPLRLPAERIAAGVILLWLLVALPSRTLNWDPLFDTAFLLAAGWLALLAPAEAPGRRVSLLVCLYLFTDAALRVLVLLVLPNLGLVFWLALAGLYGSALARRLGGVALPWRGAFRSPALWLTLTALGPLACLYLPMLHFYRPDHVDLPPVIVSFRQVTTMGPPGRLDLGMELTYRGVQVGFARAAALLLAGIVLVRLLAAAGLATAAGALRFARAAALGVAAWWLVPARGWHSLDNPVDLLFLAGLVALLAFLFGSADLARRARGTGGAGSGL